MKFTKTFLLAIVLLLALGQSAQLFNQTQTLQEMVKEYQSNESNDGEIILETDQNTVSNYNRVNVDLYTLDIELDFEQEIIKGVATLEFTTKQSLSEVHLDAWHLIVSEVKFSLIDADLDVFDSDVQDFKIPDSDWDDNLELTHEQGGTLFIDVDKVAEKKGGGFISLPDKTRFKLAITYETLPAQVGQESGFSFIKKEDTHGGKHPFFYTQNEPIYARTWFPSQDTPSSSSAIELIIKAPSDIYVWTTCDESDFTDHSDPGYIQWEFSQEIPKIRTYQVAIVAGGNMLTEEIKYKDESTKPKITVIADGEIFDQAVEILQDVHKWVDTIQGLMNVPFGFKELNIIIMPPNYPFEGAQHGTLTYVSPSILNSGRVGESVIFHEIASNYFGTMVSCANWQNLWLNEGLSTYIERETQDWYLAGQFSGIDRIDGNFTMLESFEFIDEYVLDQSFKSLHPDTKFRNPDESFTAVPFEKGYQFIIYIEQLFGKRSTVFNFLREFLLKHTNKAVDYLVFEADITAFINKTFTGEDEAEDMLKKIDFNAWITGKGEPPKNTIDEFESIEYNMAADIANKFIQFNGSARPANWEDVTKSPLWNSDMRYAFVDYFLKRTYMINQRIISQLDLLYDFKNSSDWNLQSRWFTLTSLHKYGDSENNTLMKKFLSTTGRIKQILPIYEGLAMSGQSAKAATLYASNLEFYHPQANVAILAILGHHL